MNLSTVALILLAWQLLSDNRRQPNRPASQTGISELLSDDVKSVINSAQKLSDKNCSQADRAGAIFEIMSNPALQNLAENLFGNAGQPKQTTNDQQTQRQKDEEQDVNNEGYKFETPSTASREFFRPIDNIADAEVKHKLYWFYDNWYTAK